ncbi:hypothetical protein GYA93_19405, partial [Gordonia desulfuricans]|nr:hypothetical protein [Gordonia desulfuricans]
MTVGDASDDADLTRNAAGEHWPTTDPDDLRRLAATVAGLATRADELAAELDALHHDPVVGEGRLVREIGASGRPLSAAGPGAAGAALATVAGALDRYADVVTGSRARMGVVAGVWARDQAAGEVAATLGDDSLRVFAASAGRFAMTTAGEEYADDAAVAARPDPAQSDPTEADPTGTETSAQPPSGYTSPAPAATAGMLPLGGLGALG